MGSRRGLTAMIMATIMVLGAVVAGGLASAETKKKPDWPTMPKKKAPVKIPIKTPGPPPGKPTVITPTETPGLITRAQRAFGLSIVLRSQRHDFYSEDVQKVVIGLDVSAGRILGILVIKGDETWGLYVAPRYIAFFPNKRTQARRAELVWLTAKGWATFLEKHVQEKTRD